MCLAIPGKIIEIQSGEAVMRQGRVDFGGIIKDVNLALVPEAGLGDYVIVHAGVALNVLDEIEAQRTLELLEQLPFDQGEDNPPSVPPFNRSGE
jgi:hydrogenase expression/formation protein HypC